MEGLDRAVRAAAARAPVLVLLVVSVLLFLPGFARMPTTDYDEGRFVQASRQMAASGDPVDIRWLDGTRYKKPVGIYWLHAATVSMLPGGSEGPIWHYRLVSMAGAVAVVLITYAIALPFIGTMGAFGAGLLIASALILGGEARIAKTDAVLAAFTAAAMWALAALWRGGRPVRAAGFWAAMAGAVLVKGPIAFLVTAGAALALSVTGRRWAWMRPLWDWRWLLLFLAIVLPWYIAISLRAGMAFWNEALLDDLLGKVGSADQKVLVIPGTYVGLVWATFWPGSALLALALPAIWRRRKEEVFRFALCWLLPFWVIFEFIATKRIHYVLPVYPALAILVAAVWFSDEGAPRRWARWISVAVSAIGPVLLVVAIVLAWQRGMEGMWPPAVALPVALVLMALFAVTLARGLRAAAPAVLAAMAFVTYFGVVEGVSRIKWFWPVPQLKELAQTVTCGVPNVASAGFSEPSFVFAMTNPVRWVDGAEAARHLAEAPCAVSVVSKKDTADFEAEAKALNLTPAALGYVEAFDMGTGKVVQLNVWSASAP